ncbi:porin family protein [Algibacter sp. PT7-4]|uniref:porin family protein n=1 Tax=Algibacter ulvanivorans TaxID=3400999 RepID=UPI003AAEDBA8
MKKKSILAILFVTVVMSLHAQDTKFGVTAGYNSLIASVKFDGISASDNVSGFYVGVFADIKTSEKIHIQPEVQYVNSRQDGESGNSLVIPLMGKFNVSEQFSLLLGPQLDFILEESDGIKKTGIGLSAGMSYDITDKIFASTRYSLGLNNRLDDDAFVFPDEDPGIDSGDIKTKFNFFQIGLGFRF